ncbi:sugar-transfer associated ATP-grasp domain-containing protein [Haloterrigena salinisoli]|uniref:sugar-transfer associated ATP-grasp domain-containing protein n=1 Tax=Haloterrigena salinisoli TaxID=3132747 RepID=UPI0030D37786
MNVRTLYHTARAVQELVATERESDVSRSLRRRLWLWRRGFVSRSDAVYDLDPETYRDYVSDYERFVRTKRINGTWSVALSNKLLFHRLMQPFDDERMTVYGLIRDGTYHPIDDRRDRREVTDGGPAASGPIGTGGPPSEPPQSSAHPRETGNAAQRVIDRLEVEDRLVLKWVRGGGGNNVLLCSRTGDGYRVNGDRYPESAFRSLVADLDEYLVCEFVDQGPFPTALYPATPNTIRLITMYDDELGEPFVAAAIQRIGTTDSAPLDNFTQGGLSAAIDLETGELGPGARPPDGDGVEWHSTHPDTKMAVEGERIPGWQRIRATVLEMADACPFVPYVGWDVIVTDDDGGFTVIEANSYPGLKSIQVHEPLLADDRVRRFYERHGVR